MKRCLMCVVLVLCALCVMAGCNSSKDTPYEPEDFEGTTRRTQESVLSTVEQHYIENGCIYFNPDVPVCHDMFRDFLHILEQDESGLSFDYDTVQASFTGFSVQLLTPLDAWGAHMYLWIEMPDGDGDRYVIAVNSVGSDGEQQVLGTYDLTAMQDSDDVYSYVEGHAV